MPQNGRNRRFNDDQMAAALKATGGIYSHAAAWLHKHTGRPCHRRTVNGYVEASPKLRKLVDEIFDVHLDHAEALLFKNIEIGKERSLHFLLATKGKSRGYVRRDEVSGADGAPLVPKGVDLSKLTTDQLRQVEELLAIAAAGDE
jgi:hypothetical protein